MVAERTLTIGSDLTVRRLGMGTMSLTGPGTWGPPADPSVARALLLRARELGVELFDTADSYGPDVAETALAEAFGPRYEGVTVATKAGLTRQGPGRWDHDAHPEHLRAACEASLRRLGLERLDLFQLHAVDPAVPLEESLGALVELQAQGKIRHIGICNVDAGQLESAVACAPVVSVQNRYSLAERGSDDVLGACERHGLAFVAWAPLAKGALPRTGGALRELAEERSVSVAAAALAWILHRSPCSIPIPGTSSVEHLGQNVEAADLQLTEYEIRQLERQRLLGYAAGRMRRRARMRAGALRRSLRASSERPTGR